MFDDFLEYDVDLGAALMGATNLPQIGTALITVIDRYDGQCFDCAPILHRFTVGLLTFALAARIGERRIVLVGLRGRNAGVSAILLGGSLQKNGKDKFDNHEHAARDCLNFGRNFAVRAKLLKILPDFFYLATYRGLIQTCHFSRHHFE
ncbi:MAG: hypothetical protein WJ306_07390 [Ferrovum myxofaciens]